MNIFMLDQYVLTRFIPDSLVNNIPAGGPEHLGARTSAVIVMNTFGSCNVEPAFEELIRLIWSVMISFTVHGDSNILYV